MLHMPADADTRWNIDNIENSNGDKFVLITDTVKNTKEICSKEDFIVEYTRPSRNASSELN